MPELNIKIQSLEDAAKDIGIIEGMTPTNAIESQRITVANDPATKLKLISHAWNAWRQDIALDVKLRKVQEAEIPELV